MPSDDDPGTDRTGAEPYTDEPSEHFNPANPVRRRHPTHPTHLNLPVRCPHSGSGRPRALNLRLRRR